MKKQSKALRRMVWVAAVVLGVLHHDFWFWNDRSIVLGFLPIGLFYHAAFSIAAGLVWFAAVKFAWPENLEEWASQSDSVPNSAVQTSDKSTHKNV